MIGITIEFKGRKYQSPKTFDNFPAAKIAALDYKREYPNACFYLACRPEHYHATRSFGAFEFDYTR